MAAADRHAGPVRAVRSATGRVVPDGAHLRGRIRAPGKSTADADVVEGRFVDVEPAVRVVQAADFESDDPALAGTMTMTWSISDVEGGTLVDVRADDVPAGISAEDHAAGLASSLANLAAYLEA